MEVWRKPMNRTNSSIGWEQKQAQLPPLLPPGQTDLPPSLDPELPCHISAVSSSASVMDLVAASSLSPTTSGDAGPPSPSRLSTAVRWGGSWRDWIRTRLHVQMVSAPESWKAVRTSYVGFSSTSLTSARVKRRFQWCGRHPASFQHQRFFSHQGCLGWLKVALVILWCTPKQPYPDLSEEEVSCSHRWTLVQFICGVKAAWPRAIQLWGVRHIWAKEASVFSWEANCGLWRSM